MCFIKPLKVKKIVGKKIYLENNIIALYDKEAGDIKPNDRVLVYGNVVLTRLRRAREKTTVEEQKLYAK